MAEIDGVEVRDVEQRPSRNGNYCSLRIHVHAASAEIVLEGFAVLHALDEVMMVL
jgi:putative lipoic acid-binding regulatory protein